MVHPLQGLSVLWGPIAQPPCVVRAPPAPFTSPQDVLDAPPGGYIEWHLHRNVTKATGCTLGKISSLKEW